MKINEVFSDLFKLRNAVDLKTNPLQKNGNSWGWGVGGAQMTFWKGNSKGVGGGGGKTKEPSVGGMDIFWNHTNTAPNKSTICNR